MIVACFLFALAPGQVFRFLERNLARTPEARDRLNCLELLLSDATPSQGWRMLTSAVSSPEVQLLLEDQGPALGRVFAADAPPVTLLYAESAPDREPSRWGYRRWTPQAPPEAFEETVSPVLPHRPFLSRLLLGGGRFAVEADTAQTRAVRWAREQELPIERVPGALSRQPRLPEIDYLTVAQLDQKNLLVEDTPRLYRLRF